MKSLIVVFLVSLAAAQTHIVAGKATFGTGKPNTSITPITVTSQNGSSTNFLTNSNGLSPYNNFDCWEGTPMFTSGYQSYCARFDSMTPLGYDVQAGMTVGIFKSVRSNNSGGTPNDNSTNQAALVVNASGNDVGASANEFGAEMQAQSGFTGAGSHTTQALQNSVSSARAPGWFADTTHDYSIIQSNLLKASATQDATVALGIDSSTVGKGILFGVYAGSIKQVGFAVLNGQAIPPVSFWASQASSYGLFCGPGDGTTNPLFPTNALNVPTFANTPPRCAVAGPTVAISGASAKHSWISTSAGGAQQIWDSFESSDKILHFQQAGADALIVDNNGNGVLTGASTATKFCFSANVCLTSGAGVPAGGACGASNTGSAYFRNDAPSASTVEYVCQGSTWTAITVP